MAKLAGDEMASADAHPLAITHPPLMAFSGSETRTRHFLSTPSHGLTGSEPKTDPNGNQSVSRYHALGALPAHVTPSMRFGCAPAKSPAAVGSYLGNPLGKK